jgi:hypothetical protein
MLKLSGWQLHRSIRPCFARRPQELENRASAKHWLQAFRHDSFAITAMRRALAEDGSGLGLHGLREDQIIDGVARLLESRRWHVCQPVVRAYPINLAEDPGQGAILPVPRRAPRQPDAFLPPLEMPEPATLAGNADQAAIAAALRAAAALGIPFCEECAKKAAARAANVA